MDYTSLMSYAQSNEKSKPQEKYKGLNLDLPPSKRDKPEKKRSEVVQRLIDEKQREKEMEKQRHDQAREAEKKGFKIPKKKVIDTDSLLKDLDSDMESDSDQGPSINQTSISHSNQKHENHHKYDKHKSDYCEHKSEKHKSSSHSSKSSSDKRSRDSPVSDKHKHSSSKDKHKSDKYCSDKHKGDSSNDKYKSSDSSHKHKSDKSSDKQGSSKSDSSKDKHRSDSSNDKHQSSSDKHRSDSSNDKHRSDSSNDKHQSSSDKHRSDSSNDKHRSDPSNDKHRSVSSNDKHRSSSNKHKSDSSDNKHKSEKSSDRHRSSSDKHKSESKDDKHKSKTHSSTSSSKSNGSSHKSSSEKSSGSRKKSELSLDELRAQVQQMKKEAEEIEKEEKKQTEVTDTSSGAISFQRNRQGVGEDSVEDNKAQILSRTQMILERTKARLAQEKEGIKAKRQRTGHRTGRSSESSDSTDTSRIQMNFPSLKMSKHFSFVHYNVQSILPKLHILRSSLTEFDIIGFTETWLSPKTSSVDIMFQNYNIERKDRHDDGHGGVIVYIRNNILYKRRLDLEIQDIECVWIECHFENEKHMLFGTYYHPPKSNNRSDRLIEDSFHLAKGSGSDNIIITGDFNLNQSNRYSQRMLENLCRQFSLTQCVDKDTHFTGTSSSLIDLILVSNKDNLIGSDVGVPILKQTCYHCPVFGILNIVKHNPRSFYQHILEFDHDNYGLVCEQERIPTQCARSKPDKPMGSHASKRKRRYNRAGDTNRVTPWAKICAIRKRKRVYRKACDTNRVICYEKFQETRNTDITDTAKQQGERSSDKSDDKIKSRSMIKDDDDSDDDGPNPNLDLSFKHGLMQNESGDIIKNIKKKIDEKLCNYNFPDRPVEEKKRKLRDKIMRPEKKVKNNALSKIKDKKQQQRDQIKQMMRNDHKTNFGVSGEEQRRPKKPVIIRRHQVQPPPPNFSDLLKIAEQKCKEKLPEPEFYRPPKKVEERPMTQEEIDRRKRAEDHKRRRQEEEAGLRNKPDPDSTPKPKSESSILKGALTAPTGKSGLSMNNKVGQGQKTTARPQPGGSSTKPSTSTIKPAPDDGLNPWDRIYGQIKKNHPSKQPQKRKLEEDYYSEDEDEYDEDDDFIDDGDTGFDVSSEIRNIFGYDKRKYRFEDDDDAGMEANFATIMKEEARSAKIGKMEDLEDIRREEEELRQKMARKKMGR